MDDENTLKILLTTDNHVGYLEKDPIRKDDSFNTLQEIFEIAIQQQVDFILFGGDLFHENNPSRKTLFKTMELFRNFTRGSRPCPVQLLSDPSLNFGSEFANYEDPNLNISLTAFAIHGNHDDPSGDGHLSAIDLLASSGFVNYFGKQSKIDEIKIAPVVLKKGATMLALYGLGNIRDPTLHRAFLEEKVKMVRHQELEEDAFHMLVLHQNRTPHSAKNYIPEEFLDDFLDYIFWGHEHECLIDPKHNTARDFYVTQPGSSVATSLCEGESKEKHVGLLTVNQKQWYMKKIPLKTVRPFVMEVVDLSKVATLVPSDTDGIRVYLHQKVDALIEEAKSKWKMQNPSKPDQECPLPLIRLKVEYAPGYDLSNPNRFGMSFVGKVANPKEILHFVKKRIVREKKQDNAPIVPQIDRNRLKEEQGKVSDFVNEFLGVQKLDILPENRMHDAISLFTDKDDKDAIKDFVKATLDRLRKKVDVEKIEISDEEDLVEKVKEEKESQFNEYEKRVGGGVGEGRENSSVKAKSASVAVAPPAKNTKKSSATARGKKRKEDSSSEESAQEDEQVVQPIVDMQVDGIDEDDDIVEIESSPSPPPPPKSRRKIPAAVAPAPAPAPSKTTKKQKVQVIQEEEEEEEEDETPIKQSSSTKRKTTNTRATASTRKRGTSSSTSKKMDWLPTRKPKMAPIVLDEEDEQDSRSAFQSLRR